MKPNYIHQALVQVLAMGGLVMTSCQVDRIEPTADELYRRDFIKEFGLIDPNRDWTMATRVKAVVSPSVIRNGGVINVYNLMPGNPECQIAARFTSSTQTFEFDFPNNVSRAYVQVIDGNGESVFASYVPVINNVISIGNAASRAEGAVPALYDLSNNGAIGRFPVDKDYNSAFWKSYGIDYVEKTGIPEPGEVDTETKHELWTGEHIIHEQNALHIKATNVPGTRCVLGFTYYCVANDANVYNWQVKDCGEWKNLSVMSTEWNAEPLGVNPTADDIESKKLFSKEVTLESSDKAKLPEPGIGFLGNNVVITSVYYKQLEAETPIPTIEQTNDNAKLTDAFKLYGLSSGSVSDLNAFNNSFVKGTLLAEDAALSIGDLAPIVGKEGVFHEGAKDNLCNLVLYKDKLHPAEGVEYVVTQASEISLDYFYGGTAHYNSFGYFYFKEGETEEEIMRKPKFVLMYDACPGTNMQLKDPENMQNLVWGVESQTSFGPFSDIYRADENGMDSSGDYGHWGQLSKRVTMYEEGNSYQQDEYSLIRPTNYKLVYYPLDAKNQISGPGSYTFPAGTHIGFFIITGGYYRMMKEHQTMKVDNTSFGFSLPNMNKLIGNTVTNSHTHQDETYCVPGGGEYSEPWTPFVTYRWNNRYVMGVEDGTFGGDHDMNDMLFYVNGNIVPDTPTEELNTSEVTAQSWILAVEDLGGTFDYDFNDLVIGISHLTTNVTENGTTTQKKDNFFTVTGIASGGTMPLYLYYNDKPIGGEVHSWFGVPSSQVHNAWSFSGVAAKRYHVACDENFSLSSDVEMDKTGNGLYGFKLVVDKNGAKQTITMQDNGSAPWMILFPSVWRFPKEGVHIHNAYGTGFDLWIGNKGGNDWWHDKNRQPNTTILHGWRGEQNIPDENGNYPHDFEVVN